MSPWNRDAGEGGAFDADVMAKRRMAAKSVVGRAKRI